MGFQTYDKAIGYPMDRFAKNHADEHNVRNQVYDDAAVRLLALLQEVSQRAHSMTSGARTPEYIKHLTDLVMKEPYRKGSETTNADDDSNDDDHVHWNSRPKPNANSSKQKQLAIIKPKHSIRKFSRPLIRQLAKTDSEVSMAPTVSHSPSEENEVSCVSNVNIIQCNYM